MQMSYKLQEKSAKYFKSNPGIGFLRDEVVTRVYVANPKTGDHDNVTYVGNQSIALRIGEMEFCGLEEGLEFWVQANGFVMMWDRAIVTL